MLRPLIYTLLGSLASTAVAVSAPFPETIDYCVDGCNTALGGWTFYTATYRASSPYYDSSCLSEWKVKSLYYCSAYYGCTPEELDHGVKFLSQQCEAYGYLPMLTREEAGVPADLTREDVAKSNAAFASLEDYSDPPTDPVQYIIVPDADLHALGYRTEAVWDKNVIMNNNYGFALIGFWAIIILIGMVYRALELFIDGRSTNRKVMDSEKTSTQGHVYQKQTLWSRFRAHVLLAPTFQYHDRTPIGQMTIPPRIESILIAIYIIINTALAFVNFDRFNGNLYFKTTSQQWIRYFADRSGVLAQANIQLVFLFGTRNNIFMWLTNMSFGTFNRFHRWIARIAVVHIIAHSAAYTQYAFDTETWYSSWEEEYWWTGEISTIAFCLMLGLSVLWLRKHTYDFFLVSHIIFALLALVALWYHLAIFEGQYNPWYWPAVAFWAFDRAARLVRLVAVWATAPSGRASVEYDENANIIRVDVSQYLKKLQPQPGSYYFLYTPTKLLGWESHPFTLVEWTPESDTTSNTSGSSPAASTHANSPIDPEKDQAISSVNDVHHLSNPGDKKYTFIIRPHKGFTKRLRNYASKNPNAARRMPIMVEGPYGSMHRIKGFSDVLMIMGGTGVNVAINHIHDILARGEQGVNIKLVWALRYTPFLQSVLERELKDVLSSGRVTIEAYITQREHKSGTSTPVSLADNEKGETEDWSIIKPSVAKVKFERPNCADHVATAAANSAGKLAVVVCGPSRMADDTRIAVIDATKNGFPGTAFFEEDYGW